MPPKGARRTAAVTIPTVNGTVSKRVTRQRSVPPPTNDKPLAAATSAAALAKRKRARTSEPEEPKPKRHGTLSTILEIGAPRKVKPLFSAKVMRAHFNPLPHQQPLSSHLSPRCGNPLNSFTFSRPSISNDPQKVMLIFGGGEMGNLGLGPEKLDNVKRPAVHPGVEALRVVGKLGGPKGGACETAGGGGHTLVVDGAGKVWSWGINDDAALGRQTEGIPGVEQEEYEAQPMEVEDLVKMEFKAARVAAGDSVSLALSVDGELRAWGSFRSNDGMLGFDSNVGTEARQLHPTRVANIANHPVAQVVCGYDHVLALTTEGRAYSWGNGQQHQLGRKIIERRKINGLTPERLVLKNLVLIGSGGSHSFAVHEDGTVYGWGLNTRHQLGISAEHGGDEEIVSAPTQVEAMHPSKHGNARVVAIEGGDFHTIFLLSNGEVWTAGSYESREVGLPDSHPAIVAAEAARREGEIKKKAWMDEEMARRKAVVEEEGGKWDDMMELAGAEQKAAAHGFVPGRCIIAPAKVSFPGGDGIQIVDIAAGSRHCLAVDNDGKAYSWGAGQNNQLGLVDEDNEEVDEVSTPTLLKSKALNAGVRVLRCSAGGYAQLLLGIKEDTDIVMKDG